MVAEGRTALKLVVMGDHPMLLQPFVHWLSRDCAISSTVIDLRVAKPLTQCERIDPNVVVVDQQAVAAAELAVEEVGVIVDAVIAGEQRGVDSLLIMDMANLAQNRAMSDVSLLLAKRKPFDFLSERLKCQSSRGDWI